MRSHFILGVGTRRCARRDRGLRQQQQRFGERCGSTSASGGSSGVITLGAVLPLTGDNATIGADICRVRAERARRARGPDLVDRLIHRRGALRGVRPSARAFGLTR